MTKTAKDFFKEGFSKVHGNTKASKQRPTDQESYFRDVAKRKLESGLDLNAQEKMLLGLKEDTRYHHEEKSDA